MPTTTEELVIGQEIEPIVKHMTIERMSRPLMAGGNPIHHDPAFAENAGAEGGIMLVVERATKKEERRRC